MNGYDSEIEQEKRLIAEKEQLYNENYPNYKKMIEQCMREERYHDITTLFEQKDVLELAQIDNDFAVLNIIVNIYRMELNEQTTEHIWDHMHTMDDMISFYLRLKMYLWRFEFTEDQTSFLKYVSEQKITIPCVKWLIHTSSFHKADTVYKIAVWYKERQYFVQAFQMILYLNELSSEKELIYCEMADIYIELHEYEAACECIKKIQYPTKLLEQYKQRWGGSLE